MPGPPLPSGYLRLSDLVGAPVRGLAGEHLGRVTDVAAGLGAVFPAVELVLVRGGRRGEVVEVPIERVTRFDERGAVLDGPLPPAGDTERADLLFLLRDVLDVQVVDIAARRLARVGEVDLAWDRDALRVIAIDVGWRAILRRLGLRRLARRASRDGIDWAGVHLASGGAHELQLTSPGAAVHRLDPAQIAELLARLTTARGREVLENIPDARAAAALGAVHPELAADLVEVLAPARALTLLQQMPDDGAAAALRDADDERREALLDAMDEGRAGRLRPLIARPPVPAPGAPRPPRRYWGIARGHEGGQR